MTNIAPKPIPLMTWANWAPPFKDHFYFQHGEHFPFEPRFRDLSPVNAWWLCEAALLAYGKEDFAAPRFRSAGFDHVNFLSGHSTQCYAVGNNRFAIIAFRGTECGIDQGPDAMAQFIADLSVDIDIRWVEALEGGKIHRGFNEALDEIWPELLLCLEGFAEKEIPLWLTGHSLGGALAILTAYRFRNVQGIYTFGAPRVGNRTFTSQYPLTVYPFVNNNDAIPHLPTFPYADLGEMRYIDRNGSVQDHIGAWQRFKDEVQGHIDCLLENVRHLNQGLAATLPDGLKDHAPLLYALHLWNHLISHRDV